MSQYIGFYIFKGELPPDDPQPGWMWFDESESRMRCWNGVEWAYLSGGSEGASGAELEAESVERINRDEELLSAIEFESGIRSSADTAEEKARKEGVEEALDSGDSSYIHIQGLATKVWTVVHNLGKIPSVVAFDSTGSEITGEVVLVSDNEIKLEFNIETSGKAVLN